MVSAGVTTCAGADLSAQLSTSWSLYDLNGDGRDDLLTSVPTAPNFKLGVYLTVQANDISDIGSSATLLAPAALPLPFPFSLGDFSGDGLPDLLLSRNVYEMRTTTPGSILAYEFGATPYPLNIALPWPEEGTVLKALGSPLFGGSQNTPSLADINGDGRVELIAGQQYDGTGNACQPPDRQINAFRPPSANCPLQWFVLRNVGVINGAYEMVIDQPLGKGGYYTGNDQCLSERPADFQFTDLNGDGQAEVASKRQLDANGSCGTNATARPVFWLNRGRTNDDNSTQARFAAAQTVATNPTLNSNEPIQWQDINGDRRADLLYSTGGATCTSNCNLRAYRFDGATQTIDPNGIDIATGALANAIKLGQYLDINGDGSADLMRLTPGNQLIFGFAPPRRARGELIERITNGLGAVTRIEYSSITNVSVYEREFDAFQQSFGYGSPVVDIFAGIYVVSAVHASAPINTNPDAQTATRYKYQGARMQFGGRGFLGFKQVQSDDVSNRLLTTTTYAQNYPQIGRPLKTQVHLYTADSPTQPCQGTACFVEPPPRCGWIPCSPQEQPRQPEALSTPGTLISESTNAYQSIPMFNPNQAARPLFVYLNQSIEQKYDASPNSASFGQASYATVSDFTHDNFGNATSASVSHYEGTPASTATQIQISDHRYGCVGTPGNQCVQNEEARRMARLSWSKVASTRSGETIERVSTFEYAYSNPTVDSTESFLLLAEIQGPYPSFTAAERERLEMRTDYVRNASGNVTDTFTCSLAHFPNRQTCTNLNGFLQQQWPDQPYKFQRYQRVAYESLDRFTLWQSLPFRDIDGSPGGRLGYGGISGAAPLVLSPEPNRAIAPDFVPRGPITDTWAVFRTVWGDSLLDLDAVSWLTLPQYGYLGRMNISRPGRLQNGANGPYQLSQYAWCEDFSPNLTQNVGVKVNCPAGAVYRTISESINYDGTAYTAPTSWTYFDRLGREILKTTKVYQSLLTSTDKWSSTQTRYDELGRGKQASVPYFSRNPNDPQATARAGTPVNGAILEFAVVTYDAIGRAVETSTPDGQGPNITTASFNKLQTTSTNARINSFKSDKNALGEMVKATDPNLTEVSYGRNAFGNLNSVSRNDVDKNGAGPTLTTTMQFDILGRKISMADPDKGTWQYRHNALGELISQTDAKCQPTNLFYDALGRLIRRTEARLNYGEAGSLNRLVGECENLSLTAEATATWEYDTASLLEFPGLNVKRQANGLLKTTSKGVATSAAHVETMEYDLFGRPSKTQTTVAEVGPTTGTVTYTSRVEYDQNGRPFRQFDPEAVPNPTVGTLTEFSSDGYAIKTFNLPNNQLLYETLEVNARGQVTKERFHNSANLTTSRSYEAQAGRLLSLKTGTEINGQVGNQIQAWTYGYDVHSNLKSRETNAANVNYKEAFTYDSLDRLSTAQFTIVNGVPTSGLVTDTKFSALGNLHQRGNITLTYGAEDDKCAGPHAVKGAGGGSIGSARYCHDANGNQVFAEYDAGRTREIEYFSYDLAREIRDNANANPAVSGSDTIIRFEYSTGRSLWRRHDIIPAPPCPPREDCQGGFFSPVESATYFIGNVEIRKQNWGSPQRKRYIGGYLVITEQAASVKYQYLFKDVLGSLDAAVDPAQINVVERYSFDAWGNRRRAETASPSNLWTGLTPAEIAAQYGTVDSTTRQGFTGHEMLDRVGLIHMNARLYDPMLGRFIQADTMVEDDATQGLNRYSYCLNNPLSRTDPSGNLSFRQVLGLAVGVAAAFMSFGATTTLSSFLWAVGGGFSAAFISTGSLKAGLWGALSAAVFWGIGQGFMKPVEVPNSVGYGYVMRSGASFAKVAAHAAAGGTLNVLQGGKFGHGFLSAGVTQALSPAIGKIGGGRGAGAAIGGTIVSAVVGGTVSELSGGKFGNGAETGAFQYLFNELVHSAHGAWPGDEKYDPNDPSYHNYTEVNKVCSVDQRGCTLEIVSALILSEQSAPSFMLKARPVAAAGVEQSAWVSSVPGNGWSWSYTSPIGWVTQSVLPGGLGVVNTTTRMHAMYPGEIVRVSVRSGGAVWVVSHGIGINRAVGIQPINNRLGQANGALGNLAFRDMDRELIRSWQQRYGN